MKHLLLYLGVCFTFFSGFSQEKLEVFFGFNQSNLNATALLKINNWILEEPNSKVLKIYGFCDWKGSNEYNDTLSVQRVKTVFDYLKSNNVVFDKDYSQKGFGENFTQIKNQALNRKVEIFYTRLEKEIKKDSVPVVKEKTLSEKVKQGKQGDKIRLKNILFYNNTARVLPKSQSTLFELLKIMQETPNLYIEIQGHICCQPKNAKEFISKARAEAVYNFLINHKIDRKRLTYKGYGVTQPIHPIPENGPLQEEENRRVEILILKN